MMLAELKRKDAARIIAFHGGWHFQQNLERMGIRAGKTIEVVARHPLGGPYVIKVDNMVVTIGRGMARKILVEKI